MEVPEKYRGWLKRARTGSRPLSAIRAKCLECVCWQESEVKRCHLTDCPLWLYRFGHRPSQELLERVRPTLESSHRYSEILRGTSAGKNLPTVGRYGGSYPRAVPPCRAQGFG